LRNRSAIHKIREIVLPSTRGEAPLPRRGGLASVRKIRATMLTDIKVSAHRDTIEVGDFGWAFEKSQAWQRPRQ